MGRDIMDKLGLRLTMGTQQKEGERNLLNITNTHLRISKWIFQKYPHLCTRLGRSRNHVAKSTFKSEINPTQHKGRRIPLHLVEKVENELKKLFEDKQIKKTKIMFRRIFHKPSGNNGQIRSIHQNRIRLKNTQRRNTQKQISNAKHRAPNG